MSSTSTIANATLTRQMRSLARIAVVRKEGASSSSSFTGSSSNLLRSRLCHTYASNGTMMKKRGADNCGVTKVHADGLFTFRPRHGSATTTTVTRFLSDSATGKKEAEEVSAENEKDTEQQQQQEQEPKEESEKAAAEEESREVQLEQQVKELKDQLLRSLAEQENTRRIAKRDVDQARSYAVTSFAKSLLETSDNLTRAMESVPPEYRADTENHPVLTTLYEGIKLTEDGLTKAFAKNGLVKFGEVGEKFDPNLHEALYEYPDPNAEPGTVGQVMKKGFMLNKRVIRPAEVGVVKAP